MNFNDPQWFWWMLPAAALVFILAIRAGRKRKEQLKLLLGSASDDPDAVRVSAGARRFRIFLFLLALFFLLAAAARPYWSGRILPYSRQGRDIMVLFDVSKSMLATDTAPSRLEHAKFILRELVKDEPQDRFGLVAFAGTAYTVCPLTSDPVAYSQYIDELSPDLVPVGGTNIEKALAAALRAFKAAGGSNRAIVLFTDGDELEGNFKRILEQLKKRNTPLFIVGLGDPAAGAPVPDGSGGFRRDEAGKLIVTKLAENKLIEAARATDGIYIRSTVTDTGLTTLEKRIAALDTAEQESGVRTIPVEKFPLALICAAGVFFLYLVISERPMRGSMLLFILPALLICGAAENPQPEKEAVKEVKQEEKLPELPEQLYNLAREKQENGSSDAVKLYEEVLKKAASRPDLQARSLFNIGSGVHRGGQASVAGAFAQVQAQQLDPALEKLKEAEKRLNEAEELYAGALAVPEAAAFSKEASGNLQLLEADRKKIRDLKKKIEELKKQQQQAQQDARNAQQQNRQNAGNSQQQSAMDKARESAGKLEQQAKELGQKELEKKAKEAKESLEKAKKSQAQNRDQETKKHLDDAVKALSGNEKENPSQNDGKQDKSDGKSDGKQEQPKPEKLDRQPQNQGKSGSPEQERKIDPRSAEQLLDMLKKDEQQRRNELKRRSRGRRINVEKDW
ncbi:MAG: VWA domain-containing protein [Lentisphaeria bacterium]|nr:VWA domain-containing protein [Lentisphaeria bacterium]